MKESPLQQHQTFEKFTDVNFALDTSKFVLNPDQREVLMNLRVASMLSKVEVNSLNYSDKPNQLVADLAKLDIELTTYEYLLDLDTFNTEALTTTENEDESTN